MHIPESIKQSLYSLQKNHCALCPIEHPLEAHHIFPRRKGRLNDIDNLVLLCKNHHDLADTNILPPRLLKYHKKYNHSPLSQDLTILYEITAEKLVIDLLRTHDDELLALAHELYNRLHRERSPRYQRICLQLIFAITHSSMHDEKPNINLLEKYVKRASAIMRMSVNEGYDYLQMINHYLGVAYHKIGEYGKSIEIFDKVIVDQRKEETLLSESANADAKMAGVHLTASQHLMGESEHSLKSLQAIIEYIPEQPLIYADTYCFAQIKLAEHMIVRKKYPEALGILEKLKEKKAIISRVLPVYKTIFYKDLARVHYIEGDREAGVRLFMKAITLAEVGGFKDQKAKIFQVASDLGIDTKILEE